MPMMPECNFCKRPKNKVKALIGNDGAYICDRCLAAVNEAASSEPEEPKKKGFYLGKPTEIKGHLDENVISQENAKVDVAVAIYNHFKRRQAKKPGYEGISIKKSNILMTGPSGTGKTEIARSVAQMLDVPFYVADATNMTQAGYVGADPESLLQGLLADAGGDVERAEWGIIFIDEIDKLARKSGRSASGYRDVTGEGVQQALLKIVEGERVSVPRGMAKVIASSGQDHDMVDTTNILFICAGSFAGIEEVVRKRINKDAGIGFGHGKQRREVDDDEIFRSIIEEDILEFGIIPELAGRLPILTSTVPLSEEDMVRILTEPKNAIVKQFKASFAIDGVDLQFEEAALKAIGREAKKRPTGARALRSIVEATLKPYAFSIPSDHTVKSILVTEEVVTKGAEALVVREGEPEKVRAVAKA